MPIIFDPAAFSCGCNHQQNYGAVASGDFTAVGEADAAGGVYTLNGAPCALGDIVDLAHAGSTLNPETMIDANGIRTSVNFYLKDPLRSTVLTNGCTLVMTADWVDAPIAISAAQFDNAEDQSIQAYWGNGGGADSLYVLSYDYVDQTWNDPADLPIDDQVNKLAVTFAADHVSVSVNGEAVRRFEEVGIHAAMVDFYFAFVNLDGDGAGRFKSFVFYEPVDDADLPTLSAL